MTVNDVNNGELVTVTTTEQGYRLVRSAVTEAGTSVLVQVEVVSGTVYVGVGPLDNNPSPIINGTTTYGSYTTSNSKALRSVDGRQGLRMIASGSNATVIVSW